MPATKCVYAEHAGNAAENIITGPCRVHSIYTICTSTSGEEAVELYDETTDSGTSMTYTPSISLITPKDAAFSFCYQKGFTIFVVGFGFYIDVALKTYNQPSGVTWKSPRGGVVFNRGVSLLPTSDNGTANFKTTVFYTPMGRVKP